jgi:Excalibur calcium-binding domain
MRLRSTAAVAVLGAGLSIPLTGTAVAADLDCADFATQAEAQAVLAADPGDPNRLDADDDGQACEDHPYGSVSSTSAPTRNSQVATRPVGAVAAGDGSTATEDGGVLPYVLGGLAFAGAGGAAVAARRSAKTSA